MTREQAFSAAMASLLEEYRDILAPQNCSICGAIEDGPCDHDSRDTGVLVADTICTDWVLIHAWTSFSTPQGWYDWNASPSLTMTHAVGLMEAAKADAMRSL